MKIGVSSPVVNLTLNALIATISRLSKVAATPLLLIGLLLSSCSPGNQSRSGLASRAQVNAKQSPASKEDIFLYRGIGASFLCNAAAAKVEFDKAIGVAAATYAQVLEGRHGGFVEDAGTTKLTNKQLFAGAEFQILTGALQYCPKEVPEDVKKKVEEAIQKQKKAP